MMHNTKFLDLAIDKVLELHLEVTFRFNEQNRIDSLCVEGDSPHVWFTILGDLDLVAKTLKERKMKDMEIVLGEKELMEAIKTEAKMKVKLSANRGNKLKENACPSNNVREINTNSRLMLLL